MKWTHRLARLRLGLQRSSLTLKILMLAIPLTLVVGTLMDVAHRNDIRDWQRTDHEARDPGQARSAYARFQAALVSHADLAALLARQAGLRDRLSRLDGNKPASFRALQSWRPSWLPQVQPSGSLPAVDLVMLLDREGRLLEGYRGNTQVDPETLLEVVRAGLRWNPRRTGLYRSESGLLLYASHPVSSGEERSGGILMTVTRLDASFLRRISGQDSHGLLAGVLAAPDLRILASSAPRELPVGMTQGEVLDGLRPVERFPLDSGLSDGELYLTLYRVQGGDTAGLTDVLLRLDREQRLAMAVALLMLLILFTGWISGRVQRLNRMLEEFSTRMGMTLPSVSRRDELGLLEHRFQRFSEEVLAETTALEHQALHDPLTGLPNRMLLKDRLEHSIAACLREQASMAFLLMDLDRFKEINDTLGHHIGDRLLQETAKRISEVLRKSDTIARLGGDEFAVLLPSADKRHAGAVCRKIIEAVEKPFTLDNLCLRVGVSIGIALCPECGEDSTTLMQRADVAMYNAKRGGLGFSVYLPEHDQHSISRLGLVGELKDAVDQDQLELCYQPMVDIRSGKIFAAEALVRWNHPTLGEIVPDEFIPLAEQSGVIRDLTMWVFHNALLQWSRWHQTGIELHLSLNISVRVLQDKELPGKVQRLIEHHGINPAWITLEVTESAIMSDPVTARRVLRRLSDMGLKLSIDDFGTGYSSLAYLKQLPVDVVKIDRSFVTHMDENENDAVIVRATIDLAHNLGLKVVAEGVESEEVWDLLEMLGCDVAQGFLIRHPISPGELARWIASQRWRRERWALHRLAQVPA